MTPLLLDTHVLVWLLEGIERLGRQTRHLADTTIGESALLVSAITFWEIAMLEQRQRLSVAQPITVWREHVLGLGITEVPVSGDIGILSTQLADFPPDPADRVIAASAIIRGATLVTADDGILKWPGQLLRQDARD